MSHRRLFPSQVRAAWTLYQAGYSANDISRMAPDFLGFANEKACAAAITRAFRAKGYEMREKSQAAKAHHAARRCKCGVSMDDRTPGCQRCTSRHFIRRARGRYEYVPTVRTNCVGCGCELDNRTRGCRQCIDRFSRRAKRGPARDSRVGARLSPSLGGGAITKEKT